jgi:hypothetical protein
VCLPLQFEGTHFTFRFNDFLEELTEPRKATIFTVMVHCSKRIQIKNQSKGKLEAWSFQLTSPNGAIKTALLVPRNDD